MSRWITVANRLPFNLHRNDDKGGYGVTSASGGLVSALGGVKSHNEKIWVGCAPEGMQEHEWPEIRDNFSELMPKNSCEDSNWIYQPIFIPDSLYNTYYNRCCNDVLWPLLHYQPELVQFDTDAWQSYRKVNELFAEELARIAQPDDVIWIHDFHLFLVPRFLRKLKPNARIGFFLHVPFPSSELFRQLPVREEILEALLDCDLVGFHDYSYLQHFCGALLRLLGVETKLLSASHGKRQTRLGVFPVSIDTDKFMREAKSTTVQDLAQQIQKSTFLFLGVDRLDYMKGIDLKLKAFHHLLCTHPEFREKVNLLQVAVPTRTSVPVYMDLARETARLVGEINGEFSTPNWTPVQYIHASVPFDQLIALYRRADALIVSSKRDGMNLVALEFLACQDEKTKGVLLLSEFTGAISTLSHTLVLNPWDLDDSAQKMSLAMEMPDSEKISRLNAMQSFLRGYTATDWATSFITELEKTADTLNRTGPPMIAPTRRAAELLRDRALATHPKRIVLFLDYDGTIAPIQPAPELAILSAHDRRMIKYFTRYPWLDIVILSGRDSRFLSKQFAGLNVQLASEHGAKAFDPKTRRWRKLVHRSRTEWYPAALKIISDYAARVPHSQIEKKQFSIAWHYRQSPQEYAEFQSLKLNEELEIGLANLPVGILRGKKVIEVRAIEADKGAFTSSVLETSPHGTFAIAFGDDQTDEDMFRAIRSRGISVHVGSTPESLADVAIPQQSDVLPFIRELLEVLDVQMRHANAQPIRRTERLDSSSSIDTLVHQ